MALMFLATPAYAGKSKTDDAWTEAVSVVTGSVSGEAAESQIDAMQDEMDSGYNSLDRSDYYALASKMFDKLNALSAKHGGKKVRKPGWVD
jgi:hypothetical protein